LKKHELWFSEGCSELLDQRRQAKLLKWNNGDNVNNVRHEARHFRNEKREYLKAELMSLKQTGRTRTWGQQIAAQNRQTTKKEQADKHTHARKRQQ
jgi:hypothetical protein